GRPERHNGKGVVAQNKEKYAKELAQFDDPDSKEATALRQKLFREDWQREMAEDAARRGDAPSSTTADVTMKIEEMQQNNADVFAIPEYFLYMSRAFATLEGIGLASDSSYSILQEESFQRAAAHFGGKKASSGPLLTSAGGCWVLLLTDNPTRHVENEEIAKMSTWRVEFVGDSGSGVGRIMEKLKSLEISFQHTKPLGVAVEVEVDTGSQVVLPLALVPTMDGDGPPASPNELFDPTQLTQNEQDVTDLAREPGGDRSLSGVGTSGSDDDDDDDAASEASSTRNARVQREAAARRRELASDLDDDEVEEPRPPSPSPIIPPPLPPPEQISLVPATLDALVEKIQSDPIGDPSDTEFITKQKEMYSEQVLRELERLCLDSEVPGRLPRRSGYDSLFFSSSLRKLSKPLNEANMQWKVALKALFLDEAVMTDSEGGKSCLSNGSTMQRFQPELPSNLTYTLCVVINCPKGEYQLTVDKAKDFLQDQKHKIRPIVNNYNASGNGSDMLVMDDIDSDCEELHNFNDDEDESDDRRRPRTESCEANWGRFKAERAHQKRAQRLLERVDSDDIERRNHLQELVMMNGDDRRSFLRGQPTSLLYIWDELDKHQLLFKVAAMLDANTGSSSTKTPASINRRGARGTKRSGKNKTSTYLPDCPGA
ncbi:hypothetical protein THAOC_00644, partial [Thalassiosira oceanica]